MASSGGSTKQLKQVLGFWDLMGASIGQIIGAGIMTLLGSALAMTGRSVPLALGVAALITIAQFLPMLFISGTVRLRGGRYTMVAMLAGVIYGSFYYKKPLTLWRVFAAHLAVSLVCNVLLNTLCLSVLYGKAFMILLPPRIIKNLIMWPIDSLIFFYIAKILDAAGMFRFLNAGDQKRQ